LSVFEFLLFSSVPAGHILKVPGDPADLHYIMAAAFRAYWITTKWTIFYRRGYLVSTVTGIERAHDLHVPLAADGAWCLINNQVARMAFVPPFCNRDLIF